VAGVRDAAWCYPEPVAGREYLKNHVTFAVNKGVSVRCDGGCGCGGGGGGSRGGATRRGGGGGGGGGGQTDDGAARRALLEPAPRPRGPPLDDAAAETVPPPSVAAAARFFFDAAALSSKFLALDASSASLVHCHTNCGHTSQGTAFLTPPVERGEAAVLRIHCRSKPGRMRYFVGCAEERFSPEAGQAIIQRSGWSLENLKAAPHRPGAPCAASAPPCWHVGSVVTLKVDLRTSPGSIEWEVDTTGVRHVVPLRGQLPTTLHAFVSLYNREACFEVLADA